MRKDYYAPLEADGFYHIYNCGNDGIHIFYNDENYRYFLTKFSEYLSSFLKIYSYCLLSNHFHFLVSVRSENEVLSASEKLTGMDKIITQATKEKEDIVASIVSEQFRRFLMAYSKAINKQTGRHGSLFTKRFKRIRIDNENYLQRLVYYIHNNPVHHGIADNLADYKWNTYRKILSPQKTKLMKAEVIAWFEDRENFIYMHKIGYNTEGVDEIED